MTVKTTTKPGRGLPTMKGQTKVNELAMHGVLARMDTVIETQDHQPVLRAPTLPRRLPCPR
jgi:hypothetical protein